MNAGFEQNDSFPTQNCVIGNAHHFPSISGVPGEAVGDELFAEKHFHGSETETVWSLFIMVWCPADFTGMNQ